MRQGERGMTGDHGQAGDEGRRGPQGPRGRSLTWLQALALFLVVVLTVLLLSWRSESQAREIRANTAAIQQANYDRCVAGVLILSRFNALQDSLAGIEERLADAGGVSKPGKIAAAARVNAYRSARVLPLPTCKQ